MAHYLTHTQLMKYLDEIEHRIEELAMELKNSKLEENKR